MHAQWELASDHNYTFLYHRLALIVWSRSSLWQLELKKILNGNYSYCGARCWWLFAAHFSFVVSCTLFFFSHFLICCVALIAIPAFASRDLLLGSFESEWVQHVEMRPLIVVFDNYQRGGQRRWAWEKRSVTRPHRWYHWIVVQKLRQQSDKACKNPMKSAKN